MGKIKIIRELEPKIKEVKEIVKEEEREELEELEDGAEKPSFENGFVSKSSESSREESEQLVLRAREEDRQAESAEDRETSHAAAFGSRKGNASGWRSFYETATTSSAGEKVAASSEEESKESSYRMAEQTASATLKPMTGMRTLTEQEQTRSLSRQIQRAQNIARAGEEERGRTYDIERQRRRERRRYPWEA